MLMEKNIIDVDIEELINILKQTNIWNQINDYLLGKPSTNPITKLSQVYDKTLWLSTKYGDVKIYNIFFIYDRKDPQISAIEQAAGRMFIAGYVNKYSILLISIPGLKDVVTDTETLDIVLSHEIVHAIQKQLIGMDKIKSPQYSDSFENYFKTRSELDAYITQIAKIIKMLVNKNLITKEELLTRLKFTNINYFFGYIMGNKKQKLPTFYFELFRDFIKQFKREPNIEKEFRQKIYNYLQRL